MVTAEVVEIERGTNIDPTGEVQDTLRPVFTVGGLSGTFRTDPIPLDEFTRDLARQRVRDLAGQLLEEDVDVTVQLPTGE